MALLTSVPLDLLHGHALNAEFLKRLFNFVKFERFDDGFDLLHGGLCSFPSGVGHGKKFTVFEHFAGSASTPVEPFGTAEETGAHKLGAAV
jgi:hypothetical protein